MNGKNITARNVESKQMDPMNGESTYFQGNIEKVNPKNREQRKSDNRKKNI